MSRIANITLQAFEPTDFDSLLAMSQKLWTKYKKSELEHLLHTSFVLKKNKVLLAKTAEGMSIGFSIFSIRTDYVEGADQSPTGYLEGIFVVPDYRNMGISKQFIQQGEKWCKEQGCTQLGSDTWLSDKAAQAFHKQVGFWEEDKLVHFLKKID